MAEKASFHANQEF